MGEGAGGRGSIPVAALSKESFPLLLLQHGRIIRHRPGVDRAELGAGKVVEHDAQALDEPQQDTANNGAAQHLLGAVAGHHDGPGRRTRHDRVPGVLLFKRQASFGK